MYVWVVVCVRSFFWMKPFMYSSYFENYGAVEYSESWYQGLWYQLYELIQTSILSLKSDWYWVRIVFTFWLFVFSSHHYSGCCTSEAVFVPVQYVIGYKSLPPSTYEVFVPLYLEKMSRSVKVRQLFISLSS